MLTANDSPGAGAPPLRLELGAERARLVGALDRSSVPDVFRPLLAVLARRPRELAIDLGGVTRVDSAGVALLATLARRAARCRDTRLTLIACSDAARDAIALFQVERPPAAHERDPGFLERLGARGAGASRNLLHLMVLASDTFYRSIASSPRTARVRRGATWSEALKVGVDALPIVGLVALLIGVVVGLQSAAQLRQLGAPIWVAKLIAISMVREMGPLMAAIMVAGRSGASIAAEVATMQVSQEVEALNTMGLNPTRYIVVPKLVALTITLPCLAVFAMALGIVGGYMVSAFYLDLSGEAYWTTALDAVQLNELCYGIIKAVVFAWVIVLLAAHHGFKAYGGAESVGHVTTTSVVSAVFWVIVVDAGFSLIFYFKA